MTTKHPDATAAKNKVARATLEEEADVFARTFTLAMLKISKVQRKDGPRPKVATAILKNEHLAPRHLIALMVISMNGSLTITELAAQEGIAVSTASLLVSQLADAGLVVRSEDDHDRRRTVISIHPDFRAESEAMLEERLQPLRASFTRLGRERVAAVIDVLEVIADEVHRAADADLAPSSERNPS